MRRPNVAHRAGGPGARLDPGRRARPALALIVAAACSWPGCVGQPDRSSSASERGVAAEPDPVARMETQLAEARARYEADPASEEAAIWYGRRLAYLGRYQEAIDVYTRGLEQHPQSHKLLRHRGHRYITTRQFDRAVADLERAARLIEGLPDEVEPDGLPNRFNLPRSTTHTNIDYHLGLARYLRGEFEAAADAFRRGLGRSPNDDMRVAMAYWLWLSLRRLGRDAEAAAVLAGIGPDMDVIENHAYHRLLLVFGGERPPGQAMGGDAASPYDDAAIGYGLGAWRLVNGDRDGAREAFERTIANGNPAAFGYIAAEAELARPVGGE